MPAPLIISQSASPTSNTSIGIQTIQATDEDQFTAPPNTPARCTSRTTTRKIDTNHDVPGQRPGNHPPAEQKPGEDRAAHREECGRHGGLARDSFAVHEGKADVAPTSEEVLVQRLLYGRW